MPFCHLPVFPDGRVDGSEFPKDLSNVQTHTIHPVPREPIRWASQISFDGLCLGNVNASIFPDDFAGWGYGN
jgi:hypothetical protein